MEKRSQLLRCQIPTLLADNLSGYLRSNDTESFLSVNTSDLQRLGPRNVAEQTTSLKSE